MGAAHWRAVHHIEGVPPRREEAACFAAAGEAVEWLVSKLREAAGEYEMRARGGEPGGLYVSDGVARRRVSWADARYEALDASDRAPGFFGPLERWEPGDMPEDSGPCMEVLGVNYVVEACSCDRERIAVGDRVWVRVFGRDPMPGTVTELEGGSVTVSVRGMGGVVQPASEVYVSEAAASEATWKGVAVGQYGWTDFEPEPAGTGDGSGDPDKHLLTIRDPDGEELAVIVHRVCGGEFPLDGRLAEHKRGNAEVIVAALNANQPQWCEVAHWSAGWHPDGRVGAPVSVVHGLAGVGEAIAWLGAALRRAAAGASDAYEVQAYRESAAVVGVWSPELIEREAHLHGVRGGHWVEEACGFDYWVAPCFVTDCDRVNVDQ